MIFSKLEYGKWTKWPPPEQTAIREYFRTLWASALATKPDDASSADLQSWICGIAQAEDDISPYLTQWMDNPSLASHLNLVELVLMVGVPFSGGKNAFWNGRLPQYEQLTQWLLSHGVQRKLEKASHRWHDAPFAEQLRETARILKVASLP